MVKNNIFLAYTEFHLMMSVHIAVSCYNSDEYQNKIFYLKGRRRFNIPMNHEVGGNIIIERLDFEYEREAACYLKDMACDHFFFFQENSIFSRYLAHHFKKKNAVVALAEDGVKAYFHWNKNHEFLVAVKDTVNDYKQLFKSGLKMFKVYPSRYYKYGSTSSLDEIWLCYPDQCNLKFRKRLNIVSVPEIDRETIRLFSLLFCFNPSDYDLQKKSVLYLNQPFNNPLMKEKEIAFLKELSGRFPGKDIVIKLHPLTPEDSIDGFRKIEGVKLLHSNIPAELFIAHMSDSIVFSGWSAALALNNPSCNFYFIYPIYEDINDKVLGQLNLRPLLHIRLVKRVSDINFPEDN